VDEMTKEEFVGTLRDGGIIARDDQYEMIWRGFCAKAKQQGENISMYGIEPLKLAIPAFKRVALLMYGFDDTFIDITRSKKPS
jgi:hypothetical protein